MLTDDYHEHFLRPENEGEFQELIQYVILYNENINKWHSMYNNIRNCSDMFGYKNISLYFNENMKWGDGIEEFQNGFWVNLREADYNNEGSFKFYNANIIIENGFMYIQTNYIPEESNNNDKDKTIPETKNPATKAKTKKEKLNMEIFDIKNYNDMDISFHESCGMSFEDFEYTINLSCYNNEEYEDDFDYENVDECNKNHKYKLQVYADDDYHDEIKNKSYDKCIDIDYLFFDNIFKKLKNVNLKVFLYDNPVIEDVGGISLIIRKNNTSINIFYYDCEDAYRTSTRYRISELNKILNEIKRKINFDEWYLDIQKKHNFFRTSD